MSCSAAPKGTPCARRCTARTAGLIFGLCLANVAPAPGDLRIQLAEIAAGGDHSAVRAEARRLLAEHPAEAHLRGLDLLLAELAIQAGEQDEARRSLEAALGSGPTALRAFVRLRLAQLEERGAPLEQNADLLRKLFSPPPPRHLQLAAAELVGRAIDRGADCRLLTSIDTRRLQRTARRALELSAASCAWRGGQIASARTRLSRLLDQSTGDDVARRAAERLLDAGKLSLGEQLLVARALHDERRFERALSLLQPLLDPPRAGLDARQRDESTYLLARSLFWLERLSEAGDWFDRLATATLDDNQRRRALFQRARCLELSGRWEEAAHGYRRAYEAGASSEWAPSALLGALRVEWRSGREEAALELYARLRSRRRWVTTADGASLFLASSELVQNRSDRAGAWLDDVQHGLRSVERSYWQGRLEEQHGQRLAAISSYLELLREDSAHPLADAARRRLSEPDLAAIAKGLGQRMSRSTRRDELHSAVLLLDPETPAGAGARRRLGEQLARDPRIADLLAPRLVPPSVWPLWNVALRSPEEQLLGLGLWSEVPPATVLRHFPNQQPLLALTSGVALARAGAHRSSLYVVESLLSSLRGALPPELQPAILRQSLYPVPFRRAVVRESRRHGADPHLLLAIMREESRFDATALSAAAARGLTQFVLPTAERIGPSVGLASLAPEQLYEPEVSIALGASYLGQLTTALAGRREAVIAAYNAGEPQTRLWLSHCLSREPEELLAKVSFSETRGYLRRVLGSWQAYRDLYPELAAEARPSARPG